MKGHFHVFLLVGILFGSASASAMTDEYMQSKITECWAEYDKVAPYATGGPLTDATYKAIAITSRCRRLGVGYAEEMRFAKVADCHSKSGSTKCDFRKPTPDEKAKVQKASKAVHGQ